MVLAKSSRSAAPESRVIGTMPTTRTDGFRCYALVAALCLVLLQQAPAFGQADPAEFKFSDFKQLDAFTLNGSASEYAADKSRAGALRLTKQLSEGGSAFLNDTVAISSDASFSTYFRFRISQPMGISDGVQGADGIVFVIQTLSSKVGAVGGGMGYQGVAPSVGIEFDTWKNGWDADGNHVGVNVNGNTTSVKAKPVGTPFNNGEIWHAWIDYRGDALQLEIRWSRDPARPERPFLTHDIDLTKILGQSRVFVGFSSGTGAAGNIHDILSWEFAGRYKPIGPAQKSTIRITASAPDLVMAPGRIALILDASGSMMGRLPGDVRKIQVAKKVVSDLVRQLPQETDLALRVYGHRYHRDPKDKSCTDTELVVPFGPVDKAALIKTIAAISPRGQTPIGLSLSRLPGDFGDAPGAKQVVLVTDGIETCSETEASEYYPPLVVDRLKKQGYDLRINIIGFDIDSNKTRQFLKDIAARSGGTYLDAGDAGQLSASLSVAFATGLPFQIVDRQGTAVANGSLNGDPVEVPPGRYDLRFDVRNDPAAIKGLDIEAGHAVTLEIVGRKGRELLIKLKAVRRPDR